MAHDVFISYSSKDKHVADAMCNKLESNGIRCWMAPRDILAGMDWGEAIMHAINKCQLMVLVFSANANASKVIKKEVERAASKGVMVVPFRIEDVEPSISLEFYLSTSHWLDALTPPVEQHLQRLVEDVKELMPMLPTRVVNDVEGMTLATVEAKIEAEMRAQRAREVETAGRIAEEAARRLDEERAQERQEAEKHAAELAAIAEAEKRAVEIERRLADGTAPVNITNRIGMELVLVPPGSFMMGSVNGSPDEKPVHQVTIGKGFYMGKYHVTQAQWQQVMGTTFDQQKDKAGDGWLTIAGDANHPMYYVSWDEAIAFMAKLNTQNDGYTYRLPSEAEWEYAARAGTTGDHAGDLDALAWYEKNSGGKVHPVGGKQPNAFGLFDMHGNIDEWCVDWYHDSYSGAPTDGSAWVTGGEKQRRVLRGGWCNNGANACRSAFRGSLNADARSLFGFRVVAVARVRDATELSPELRAAKEEASPLRVTEEVVHRPAVESVPATMTNRIGMEFVLIPPGSFMMGSDSLELEKPVHQVSFREGFYMGKYEVTQGQWYQAMGKNLWTHTIGKPPHFKGDNLPMENVSWHDTQRLIRKLNAKEDGFIYRLPSEAEWEYACRAGTTGDYAGNLDSMAWYGNNSGQDYLDSVKLRKDGEDYHQRIAGNAGQTHPVGQKQPNAFGLYDMHGNVYEWCQDHYRENYYGAPMDGSAWVFIGGDSFQPFRWDPRLRVLRGGSWNSSAGLLRSAARVGSSPGYYCDGFGLRLVAASRW